MLLTVFFSRFLRLSTSPIVVSRIKSQSQTFGTLNIFVYWWMVEEDDGIFRTLSNLLWQLSSYLVIYTMIQFFCQNIWNLKIFVYYLDEGMVSSQTKKPFSQLHQMSQVLKLREVPKWKYVGRQIADIIFIWCLGRV